MERRPDKREEGGGERTKKKAPKILCAPSLFLVDSPSCVSHAELCEISAGRVREGTREYFVEEKLS